MKILFDGSPFSKYHVGSERSVSILELAKIIANEYLQITGEKIPIKVLGKTSPLDGVSKYVPSTVNTRGSLNLFESISLEDSINGMLHDAMLNIL